ncbi:MAG: site-specific integrase [Ruminococcaceae bacterium]|nr:site-specific integrase [Oscillospiraceae bacterium]
MAKAKKPTRNDKGDGTFRIRPNGTCEYRIIYIDEYGETKRKSFYGQSDVVCLKKAEQFLDELEMLKLGIDVRATIPEIVREKCKSDYEKNFMHEQGYSRNLYTISLIEKSNIGKTPIVDLTEQQIDLYLRSLTDYSNSIITKVYRHIKLAYKEAYNKGIIEKNLMELSHIRCPKSNKKDKKVTGLTREEQNRLVEFLKEYKPPKNRNVYKAQILISLYSGMRMGEVNALKPENIDFKNGVIHVRSTVSRGLNYENFIKDGTKTYAGIRDIPIMEGLKPILEDAINSAGRNKQGLLFYDYEHDKIISTSQVNLFFKRACEKCDIEERGQHALRHTFATRCIEANIPAVVLKNWLGHTDIHVTLDTYADVFSSMHNESILKLDTYINNLSSAS